MSDPAALWQRSDLHGARWSSAVRCVAKAEYQALGIEGTEANMGPLLPHFERGVNAAHYWAMQIRENYSIAGEEILAEVPVKWGPDDIWEGHADIVIPGDKLVLEAYHSVGGKFVEVKALQVAFYARKLGPEYRGMLHALDTTELLPDDGGFVVTPYAVDVDGLADQVADIEARVIAAYRRGAVSLEDRVGDGPDHPECKHCPFRELCWQGFEPTPINEVPELVELLDRLVMAQSNAHHLQAATDEADNLVRELKAQIRPHIQPGQTIRAGDVQVKRILTMPRRGFKLTDYLKAGHPLTATMRDFATESDHPGERWYFKRISP